MKRIVDFAALVLLSLPAVALAQTYASDVGIEIPTPTWLAYDKAFYGDAAQLPDDALLVHQERAYTSPI